MSINNSKHVEIYDGEFTHIAGNQFLGRDLTINYQRERPLESSGKRGRQALLDSGDTSLIDTVGDTRRELTFPCPPKKKSRTAATAESDESRSTTHDRSMTRIRDNFIASHLQINNTFMVSDMTEHNHPLLIDPLVQSNFGRPQPSSMPPATNPPFLFKPALPQPPECMIGKDEQRCEVIETLLHNSPARIAILGGGGTGKTTLALSVLHDHAVAHQYPSRYFVSCEGVLSFFSLIGEIANALRIPSVNRDAHLIETVFSSFPENSLLSLDNFETIWEDEGLRMELEELLSHLQQHVQRIIITMRGTQRPSRVYSSKPLFAPLQPLNDISSRHIFEITSGQKVDEFVEKLLNAVEGIPLAISLISHMV